MLLVSWTGLLDKMSARTRDEPDAEADIRQLRGLANFAEEGRFRPMRDGGEDFGPDSRHMRDMKRLIDAATEQGIAEGWASRRGLNRTPRAYGYGRYLRLADRVVWFGVHTERWERDGETPLWLDYGNDGWVPIPIAKDVVEYADILDGVVATLRDFAEASENRR